MALESLRRCQVGLQWGCRGEHGPHSVRAQTRAPQELRHRAVPRNHPASYHSMTGKAGKITEWGLSASQGISKINIMTVELLSHRIIQIADRELQSGDLSWPSQLHYRPQKPTPGPQGRAAAEPPRGSVTRTGIPRCQRPGLRHPSVSTCLAPLPCLAPAPLPCPAPPGGTAAAMPLCPTGATTPAPLPLLV